MTCEINQRPDTASHRALHVSVTYVFLEHCALLAIVRIGHARIAAYDAAPLVAPVVALVADPYERCRAHVRVANDTLSVACGGFIGFLLFLLRPFDHDPIVHAHDARKTRDTSVQIVN